MSKPIVSYSKRQVDGCDVFEISGVKYRWNSLLKDNLRDVRWNRDTKQYELRVPTSLNMEELVAIKVAFIDHCIKEELRVVRQESIEKAKQTRARKKRALKFSVSEECQWRIQFWNRYRAERYPDVPHWEDTWCSENGIHLNCGGCIWQGDEFAVPTDLQHFQDPGPGFFFTSCPSCHRLFCD